MIDYFLPDELIASKPSKQRDGCRMLVYNRKTDEILHAKFHELDSFLNANDFLVLNQARVDPARVYWNYNGKRQEVLFLNCVKDSISESTWEAIVSGKKLQLEKEYEIKSGIFFRLLKDRSQNITQICVNRSSDQVRKLMESEGELPIPPYIMKRRDLLGESSYQKTDTKDYQTVFGQKGGAVAAPTAGLHFTEEVFRKLDKKVSRGSFFICQLVGVLFNRSLKRTLTQRNSTSNPWKFLRPRLPEFLS